MEKRSLLKPMCRKSLSAHHLLIACALILPGILLPLTFLPVSDSSSVVGGADGFTVRSHLLTSEEAAQMELAGGSYVNGTDYNVVIDGHGTGLAPMSTAQYSDLVGALPVTDSVQTDLMAPSSCDLSTQPYFPQVGNQGSQGSCAAWAMTYYDYGYLEARDNNWTDASTGNPAHLLSPAWTYNRVDHGVDRGTFMDNIADVIRDWGAASMKTMPYAQNDLTSWGSEAAFREAPLHRATGVSYISYSASNPSAAFTTIKNLISSNVPVTFAIDANQFSGHLGDYVIVASEYNSTSMNHAQTIVGYNDTMTVPGQPDIGAFKVVNSWGTSFGNKGYYWISYDAMKKIGSNLYLTYITDRPSYQPSLLAIIEFNNAPSRDSALTLGVGTVGGSDTFIPYFERNDASVSAAFPTFMAIDMTGLLAKYQAGKTSFYLTLAGTNTAGNVSSFRIEQYQDGYARAATQVSGQSPDVPRINPGSVSVTLAPYSTILPAIALDNGLLTLNGSGGALWSPETRDSHQGGSAMQSGNVGNGGKSAIQTTVLGPSSVSFWWKTSTQSTDRVRFYVDSFNLANASGTSPWTQVTANITSGTHLLKWEYGKDATIAGNQDLVLLDQVQAVTGATSPGAPIGLTAVVSSSIRLNWSAPPSDGGSSLTSYRIYRGTASGTESFLSGVGVSTTVFTDSTASVGQDYYYQITALNAAGESSRSNEVIGAIPVSVPSPPSSMTALAGPSYIDISWASNGVNVTGFHLYRGTVANGESLFKNLSASDRTFRDSTVVAGTAYFYRTDACNGLVSSSQSAEVSARIPTVPNAPTSLAATAPGSAVHLAWWAPLDNGGSAITSYKVFRGISSGGESLSPLGFTGSTSFDDLTVSAGVRYYYLVKSCNAIGDSGASNEANVRVPTIPGAPVSLTSSVASSHIHLSWSIPADNGGVPVTQYSIYRGTSPGAESATAIGISGTTSYDDASTAVGTQYFYVVKARNSIGESGASNEASGRIVQAPNPPTSLSVTATLGHESLTWTGPAFNGGSAVNYYEVFRGTTSDQTTQVQIGTASITTYDDSQISVGQTYYYTIKAVNVAGDSIASNMVSALVKGLPGAPARLSTQIGDRSLIITWSAPASNGFSQITDYCIYRSNTPSAETFVTIVNGTTYTDNGLINGNVYYYRVSAVNAMGEGIQCPEVHNSPGAVPAAPVISGDAFSGGSVDFIWSSPENGGRPISGYTVFRGTSPDFTSSMPLTGSILVNSYHDTSASPGLTYYYFVTAQNSIGTSAAGVSGPVFVSGPPSAPCSVTTAIDNGYIRLSWSPPLYSGLYPVSGYNVYRSLASGSSAVIAHPGNVMSFVDQTVVPGQTYYYSVSAENEAGEGPLSSIVPVQFVLVPDPPSQLKAEGSMSTATLSWIPPADNGASLSGYSVRMWTMGETPSVVSRVGPGSSTAIIGGLTNGVEYWFSVSAINSVGEGASSQNAECVVGAVPSAPLDLSTLVGNGSITLSWKEPASDGGLPELSYHVWRSTNRASAIIADLGDSTSYVDGSVVPGTFYNYFLTASNIIGTSVPAGPSGAFAAVSPAAPSWLAVSPVSKAVMVAWNVPGSDGGVPVTGYNVYRSSGAGWTLLRSIDDPTTLSYLDGSVSSGVAYQYRISALNIAGEGYGSDPSPKIVPLSIPSAFRMTATVGNANVTLVWNIPSSYGAPLLSYTINRTESDTGAVTLTTVSPTVTRYFDATVIPGHDYVYAVIASNAAGFTSTDQVTVRALRCALFNVQIVPYKDSISVDGTVTDLAGHAMPGQKVTIYRSSSLTGQWISVVQLVTSEKGNYSAVLSQTAGTVRLRAALSDDGTHLPITLDRTVSYLDLDNGDLASIMSDTNMSDVSVSGSENKITFSLEQAGAANISIPKDSISDPDLITVMIDGKQGNYQVIETDDHYIVSLSEVKAGQVIALSIDKPADQDAIPMLMEMSLFIGASLCAMFVWCKKKERLL
jgi:fibronectin type 3 domain-containing protein